MIRNSIVAKLWVTIVGMVILVLVLLAVLLQQFFDNYVYEQQGKELSRLSQSVHRLIEQNDITLAQNVASQLASVQNAQITIKAPYQSYPDMAAVYQEMSPGEQSQFVAGQPVIKREDVNGVEVVSVYMIVPSTGQGPGMQVVTQPMSVLDEPLTRMRNLIFFASMLGVLMTTGLAFVVSKNLSRPLVQMNRAAEEMARGKFGGKIQVLTTDEVGRLGRTFNELANELEKTIAALSIEKEQLSSILASLEDGVVAADLQGRITLANPPALKRFQSFKRPDGSPLGQSLPQHLMEVMNIVVMGNQTVIRELPVQSRDIVVTMTPLFESDASTIRGVVAVVRDVTEERRLDRLRKDFIANVSHELRTPLSMMQGYAEALLDEFGDDPEQRRELAGIIHDETLRMKRLVNGLLDLAQLESGQFHMNREKMDIVGMVQRIVRKFTALAADRQIQLTSDVPPRPIVIEADEDRLEQVFINLLDNAIRHTAEEGQVTISVREDSGHVQVYVEDNGAGIPEEDIPYIWERFYKADKARTRGRSGTGLGLAITRHIVVEHHGDIRVKSHLGEGTTFVVSLPTGFTTESPTKR